MKLVEFVNDYINLYKKGKFKPVIYVFIKNLKVELSVDKKDCNIVIEKRIYPHETFEDRLFNFTLEQYINKYKLRALSSKMINSDGDWRKFQKYVDYLQELETKMFKEKLDISLAVKNNITEKKVKI